MSFDPTYENVPFLSATEISTVDGIGIWDANGGDGSGAPKMVAPDALAQYFGLTLLGTVGTKVGTAGSKFGFFGATPVAQPASAQQASLANSTGGTPGVSLIAFPGTATVSLTALTNVIASIWNLQNEMRTALVNTGIMKGSA